MTDLLDDSVTSLDGTRIGYRRLGAGPGLIVLHGSMCSGASHRELARSLAERFTVWLPDRRGHGLGGRAHDSGGYRPGPTLPQETEDLQALLAATGARHVFAVSSGALVALHTALVAPDLLDQVVLFEPPLLPDAAQARQLAERCARELDGGDLRGAMVTAWRASEMGPAVIRALPRPLLTWMVGQGLAAQERKGSGDHTPMRVLAGVVPRDLAVAAETAGDAGRFAPVAARVLLLGGSRSPGYLRAALDALEQVLPHARRVEIPGVGHECPLDTDLRGRPELVAREVRSFLDAVHDDVDRR